jgi:hypothetical protein
MSVLQDFISDVISSEKRRMNVGPTLEFYEANNILNGGTSGSFMRLS